MKKLLALLLSMMAGVAAAQTAPTLTFTAGTTTGNGSVVPVLTWSTSPAGATCIASGDAAWSGTKAASGSQTLAAVTTSKTYNLACSWPGANGTFSVSWVPPTTNTDGSPLTDLVGYKLYRSLTSSMSSNVITDIKAPANTYTSPPLPSGKYYLVMSAVNAAGAESDKTPVKSVDVIAGAADVVTRTVGITVNPVPMAPVWSN